MAYFNGYNPSYSPQAGYYNVSQTQQPQYSQPEQVTSGSILWVKDENSARDYPMARGSRIILMDSQKDLFYVKTTDVNGIVNSFRVFKYEEVENSNPLPTNSIDAASPESDFVTKKDFDARIQEILSFLEKATEPREVKNE